MENTLRDGDFVWVVGLTRTFAKDKCLWDLQGVFVSEGMAITACKDINYFVAPIEINRSMPQNVSSWPGLYYPKALKGENYA